MKLVPSVACKILLGTGEAKQVRLQKRENLDHDEPCSRGIGTLVVNGWLPVGDVETLHGGVGEAGEGEEGDAFHFACNRESV